MELGSKGLIEVEVVYALSHRQKIVTLEIPSGTTAREAAILSGMEQIFPGLVVAEAKLGIFGQLVDDNTLLNTGDRVEIYRPLLADPKQVRRQLAAQGKTMGGGKLRGQESG